MAQFISKALNYIAKAITKNINGNKRGDLKTIIEIIKNYDAANLTTNEASEILSAIKGKGLKLAPKDQYVFSQYGLNIESILHLAQLDMINAPLNEITKKRKAPMFDYLTSIIKQPNANLIIPSTPIKLVIVELKL